MLIDWQWQPSGWSGKKNRTRTRLELNASTSVKSFTVFEAETACNRVRMRAETVEVPYRSYNEMMACAKARATARVNEKMGCRIAEETTSVVLLQQQPESERDVLK